MSMPGSAGWDSHRPASSSQATLGHWLPRGANPFLSWAPGLQAAEKTNGRAAMLGLAVLAALEWHSGFAFF